jgi:hypothetical protein
MSIEVDQTYKNIHFLSPFVTYAVDLGSWPEGHPWRPAKLVESDPNYYLRLRPRELRNPEWLKYIDGEGNDDPETLYNRIQSEYNEMLAIYQMTNEQPPREYCEDVIAHWFGVFLVFRGFALTKRVAWNFTRYIPEPYLSLMPADIHGPEFGT